MLGIMGEAMRLGRGATRFAIDKARSMDERLAAATIKNAQDAARASQARRYALNAPRTSADDRSQGAA